MYFHRSQAKALSVLRFRRQQCHLEDAVRAVVSDALPEDQRRQWNCELPMEFNIELYGQDQYPLQVHGLPVGPILARVAVWYLL